MEGMTAVRTSYKIIMMWMIVIKGGPHPYNWIVAVYVMKMEMTTTTTTTTVRGVSSAILLWRRKMKNKIHKKK
jgi:hypothetical protein